MKFTKYIVFFYIFILCSCVSTPIPMPGETQKKNQNIYIEYMNIGDAYNDLEKYDKAITYYNLAKQDKKLYWNCYYKLAKIYAIQSEWTKALEMYLVIQKRDKENDSIKSSLAYLYAMNGQNDKALEIYKSLIEDQEQNVEYLENYLSILIQKNDLENANLYFDILKEKFPDSKNISHFEQDIKTLSEKLQGEDSVDEGEVEDIKTEDIENSDTGTDLDIIDEF